MFRMTLLLLLIALPVDLARSQEMQSTIVDLRKHSQTLTQTSTDNYRQPVEEIKKTLRENVAKAVQLRKQLDERPNDYAIQAQYESVVSSTLSELDHQMGRLLEGKPAMDAAIRQNLEVVSKIRQQLSGQAQSFQTEFQKNQQASTQIDSSLNRAAEKLAPMLQSGAELPVEVETHVRKLMIDLKAHEQKSKLAEMTKRELQSLDHQLERYQQVLVKSGADLEINYHSIAAQRTLLGSLAAYRSRRANSRQMTQELGSFAKGIGELSAAIEGIDLSVIHEFTADEGSVMPAVENIATERPGAKELLRRSSVGKSSSTVARKENGANEK